MESWGQADHGEGRGLSALWFGTGRYQRDGGD